MKLNTFFGIILLFGISLTSCGEDYLNTKPTDQMSEETVGATLDGLFKAINGIHRQMISQTPLSSQGMGGEGGFLICREALGDDMTWDTQTWHQSILQWASTVSETSTYNVGFWRSYYAFIANANIILEKLDASFAGSTEPLASYVRGEALAIRAWSYFHLVQLYAKRYATGVDNSQPGVPYRTTGDPGKIVVDMARTPVEEVYTHINEDLSQAATLLDGYYNYLSDNGKKTATHYTKKVVLGLQARVALTQQNYQKAAEYASQAITLAETEGNAIMKADQLDCGFANITTDTQDALYAAQTLNDETVYFYSFYAYMAWNFNSSSIRTGIKCISQTTYDLMSATDLRRAWWDPTGTASVPASNFNKRPYQNRKFRARSSSDPVGDVAFMRLTELYLIAAEAYARSGDDSKAKTYFDALMKERDPQYTTTTATGSALAEEIMNCRRIELWGEGFRWFDLKRLHMDVNRTGSNYNIAFCGFIQRGKEGTEGVKGWYHEIPKVERDANKLAVRNYE